MRELNAKTIVVTGGGQGIGLGISQVLLEAGATLIVIQRSPIAAELTAQDVQWIAADLALADSFVSIAEKISRDHHKIDALVNNAGFMFEKSLEQMQLEDWNQMLAVNLTAPAFLSRMQALTSLPLKRRFKTRGTISL